MAPPAALESKVSGETMPRTLTTNKTENGALEAALALHRRGWCIIPIPTGSKKARIKWKRYQTSRPDEEQLRRWFTAKQWNLAVVLGDVSGGLTCRDFDDMAVYNRWAVTKPDLAATLPTVRTARGRHVYFVGHVEGVKHIEGGELRGGGGYCLLPPSLHPDGKNYAWTNGLNNGNLLELDAANAGFLIEGHVTECTESTEITEKIESTEAIGCVVSVEDAISLTLPRQYGTRNHTVFGLARALQSLPEFVDADPRTLREIVQEWHRRGQPYRRTEPFEETWIDFLVGWSKVKYPMGAEPMAQIITRAMQAEPPAAVRQLYPENAKLQTLAALCRELQKVADKDPFFLSARKAGELLEVKPMTAWRWLFLLEQEGIVKTVCKGGTAENPRKASRYRYIAEKTPAKQG